VIIELEAFDDRRHRLARGIGQGIAIAVVVGQPVVDNRLRNCLTATAAHGACVAIDGGRQVDPGWNGLTTVVAIADVH